ncbi:Homeodomain-like superfamily protein [Hirschfeldia incana]|nr:Homeodomain-like superfamily protein [Hirschfeldia incana]
MKQLSLSTSQPSLSTQTQDPVSLDDVSTIVPDSEPVNHSTIGTNSKENVFSEGLSVLRACSNVNSEEKKFDNGAEEAAPAYPDNDPIRQDSGHFVTQETDEIIRSQTPREETGEEECHWNMETLNIVQEEGIITTAFEQHTGKFQPKPRLQDAVIEEPESHCSVDYTTDANQSALMVIVESNEVTSLGNTVVEEAEETRSGRKIKKGKSKRARKQKTTSEVGEPNKSPQKKFKHSSRRQRNRTLEKELLETPDDEIKYLPIRDMLRLVEYREWMEKKEAKGAPIVPPTQESNTNASEENHYYSQGFDAEDEYGMMVETEDQENNVVKPDSPVNYQTYMNKTPRTRWSKQDTELFYEGIQEFGGNLSMVQQLFPDRTRQQIKLKFKLEERRNPLKINDALSTRSKHITHFHTVIKKLQEEAAAEREGEEEDGEEAETTLDVPESEEPAKSEETGDGVADVKEPDGGDNGEDECEGDDDDNEFWNSYKSDM